MLAATSSIGCSDTASVTIISNGSGVINTTENISACRNTTITYPDGTTALITGSTSHVSQLTSTTGYDFIITTTVLVVPFLASTELEAVCTNTTLTYADGTSELITENTTHTSNLTASTGCNPLLNDPVGLGVKSLRLYEKQKERSDILRYNFAKSKITQDDLERSEQSVYIRFIYV